MNPILLLCTFFLFFYSNLFAQQKFVVLNSHQNDEAVLKNCLEVYPDSSQNMSFDALSKASFRLYTSSPFKSAIETYWFRIQLDNQDAKASQWYLGADGMDELTWYIPQKNGSYATHFTGTTVPMSKRDVKNGKMAFVKVLLEPGKQTIYCQVKIHSLYAKGMSNQYVQRLAAYSPSLFKQKFEELAIYHAIFLGALLIMIFYNLAIYLSLRDISYFLYVFYAVCFGWFAGNINGYSQELLFPEKAYFFKQLALPSMLTLIISYTLFSRSFLQLKKQAPFWDKILLGVSIAPLFVFPLYFIPGFWLPVYKVTFVFTMSLLFVIMYVAFRCYLKGFKPALFFIVAEGLFLLSNTLFTLYHLKIIPQTPATRFIEHSILISFLIGLALYSLGLASRFNIIKKALAVTKLEKEQEKQRIIEEKNKELEEKVTERTQEITQQNEELQQRQEEITTQRDRIEQQNQALQEVLSQLNSKKKLIEVKNEEITQANTLLEKKIAERTSELNHAYKNLLETNNELDLFIYRSAHDLKGPIARLLGLCYLGKLEIPDNTGQNYIGKLELSAKEMDYILSRLTRVHDIKKHKPQIASIDFNQIVDTIIAKYQTELQEKNIKIDTQIESFVFQADYMLMETLLDNLIHNAITYQHNSKSDLFIKIMIQPTTNHKICILVEDNGTGIDPTVQSRIFEMFYKGSELSHGTGLGLYEAQIIAKKMNGDIQLKSTSPELTAFEVILPVNNDSVIL